MFDDLTAADAESSINEASSGREERQILFTPPGGAAAAQREEDATRWQPKRRYDMRVQRGNIQQLQSTETSSWSSLSQENLGFSHQLNSIGFNATTKSATNC